MNISASNSKIMEAKHCETRYLISSGLCYVSKENSLGPVFTLMDYQTYSENDR